MTSRSCLMATRYWRVIIIIFLLSIKSIEIISLFSANWFYQSKNSNNWHGGLFYPNSDSAKYAKTDSYFDILDKCERNTTSNSLSQDECLVFKNLWISGVTYGILECGSILFVTISLAILILDIFRNIRCVGFSVFSFWMAFILHLAGFWVWSGLNVLFFSENCEEMDWDSINASSSVCGEDGTKAALGCLLMFPFAATLHTFLYWSSKIYSRRKENETSLAVTPEPHQTHEPGSISVCINNYFEKV
ncbi:unnamed protein product [Blepharisma stoltei]|uniref:Uncharacterized protein n=1 Tax=Blepharisma stoltei TaxID=1481888 RepID=A0AAU9J8T1_9CILI|nr:unnamed protein product [Blepharisma stoltei]